VAFSVVVEGPALCIVTSMRWGLVVQIDGRASSNRALIKNHNLEKIKTRRFTCRWLHVLFPVMYHIWKSRGRRGGSTASRSAATLLSSSIAPQSPVSQCASNPTPHSLTPTPQLTYRRTTRRRISPPTRTRSRPIHRARSHSCSAHPPWAAKRHGQPAAPSLRYLVLPSSQH
jgi:hypothetical protein